MLTVGARLSNYSKTLQERQEAKVFENNPLYPTDIELGAGHSTLAGGICLVATEPLIQRKTYE
jgi:hypothetical protein